MNIEKAKQIPLPTILSCMGAELVKERPKDLWYKSPFRQEKTASLHVSKAKNVWYDHGMGKGGDGISLVELYLKQSRESDTLVDALRWLRNMTGSVSMPIKYIGELSATQPGWLLKNTQPIERIGLIRYLEKRKIPPQLAKNYLQEITVQNRETGSTVFALGLMNEEEGYELRNPFLKSCIAPKAISFIRGETVKPTTLHLFEGLFDFLSAAYRFSDMIRPHDAIVLNSVSLLPTIAPYIQGYGYQFIHTWLDNDSAGRRAASELQQLLSSERTLICKPMNDLYAPFKDVNEWHVKTSRFQPYR